MDDNPKYKAIETIHSGFRFRSRLEARWAVFFEKLGIEYRYEPEGIDLDGTWYLPDFYLPKLDYWIEIKGQAPTEEELLKAYHLTKWTRKPAFVFGGDCWYDTRSYAFEHADFTQPPFKYSVETSQNDKKEERCLMSKDNERICGIWLSEHEYRGFNDEGQYDPCKFHIRYGFHLKDQVYWAYPKQWAECSKCKRIWINRFGDCNKDNCACWSSLDTQGPCLIAAYKAARQARF